MTPETFLNEFKHLTNAPGGVTHLRETVLALAMRGELTKSTETDSAYAPDFEAARNWLAANAKELSRSRWRNSESVQLEEQPFALPKNWMWARVNDTGLYTNGLAFKPSDWCDSGTPIIRIQNLTNLGKPLNHARGDFPRSVTVEPGDLLVSWSATLAAFVWRGREAVLNQHIYRVEPCPKTVRKQFLFWLLTWAIKRMATSEAAHGLVMTHINRGPFLAFPIPVPPLDEQDRIASKIDELMALCDDLEAQQTESRRVQLNLCQSALQRLGDANNPTERARNWTFVHNAFPDLLARPENIRELRKTILQLAVTGHLVPQNPKDEPVDIDQAAKARDALASGRRKRKRIRLAPEPEDAPLPLGWQLSPFDAIADIQGGVTKGRKLAGKETVEVPYLRVANVQRGYLDLTHVKTIQVLPEDTEKYKLLSGDLLITEGGDWDKVGRTALWEAQVEGCLHQNHIFRARLPDGIALNVWILLYMNADLARSYFADSAKQTTNLASINMTQLRSCPIPLPPLAEQKRIVAKVDELMHLCDRLEQQLTEAETTAQTLTATATATFTTTDNTRNPADEAPNTDTP